MPHTPGPWQVGIGVVLKRSPNKQDRHIAEILWKDEQAEANARLIAAAPDLFAAIKWLRRLGVGVPCDADELKAAVAACDAAIARAEQAQSSAVEGEQ